MEITHLQCLLTDSRGLLGFNLFKSAWGGAACYCREHTAPPHTVVLPGSRTFSSRVSILQESSAPVGWSSLLVIRNVPSTPSGSSEVQRLVRRFGTVIETLVLNSMVRTAADMLTQPQSRSASSGCSEQPHHLTCVNVPPAQVICEMATAAMALSVYKRFQAFPCIIQNNPLFFSRKPDPKLNTQAKVISAYLDSSEVSDERRLWGVMGVTS